MTLFPALAERQVRLYLVGQFVSMLGSWVLDITLNLLVWQATHSPAVLGALNALLYGPSVLVTPLLGTRLTAGNARRITLTVLVAALGVALLLLAAAVTHGLPIALLLSAALARGILGGMEVPSRQMLLMNISDDAEQRSSAIALNTVAFLLARTLGPGLAAVMFEPLGPAWGFAMAALATSFMLTCVARLRAQVVVSGAAPAGRGGAMGQAWAFVRTDRLGTLLLPMSTCVALCVSAYQTLIPVLASRVFGDAPRWTGRFFAAAGVGALIAAVMLSSRHLEPVVRRLLMVVPWTGALALAVLGATERPAVALASFAVLGFCTSFVGTATNTLLHRRIPPEARGGLIGLFLLAFNGAMPLGQLLAGTVAGRWSAAAALFLLSALLFAALLLLCGCRWRELGRVELDVFKV
jgi:predicted MFS family arabinose efflux permease